MEKTPEFKPEPELSPEKSAEILDRIIGKVTIMRHGQTEYTEEYPDLTELGKEQIAESARKIKGGIGPEDDVLVVSSPAVRAQGSADIVRGELGIEEKRILKSLRPIKANDPVEFKRTFDEFWGPGGFKIEEIAKWDRFYAADPRFENRPEVQEPRSNPEKRSLRGLNKVIGFMSKYRTGHPDRIPHL
ncbi:MAG: histidine phosphatase family protein, partial [Candidatus Sungbacteria bacterium]|nr:histidine phosphatase family protein [Candidatus Sungbacteria bacterium]